MVEDREVKYFNGENNPASDIKTLVELAERKEHLVVKTLDDKRMLVKAASCGAEVSKDRSDEESTSKIL